MKEVLIKQRDDFFAIIMAGGRGTRFWPLSRTDRPKQLLKMFGEETLLEETIERIAPLIPPANILIITGENLVRPVRQVTRRLIPARNVLAEPAARNTSPAIALATASVMRRNPKAVLAVLPSDHLIANPRQFLRVLDMAYRTARDETGSLVTLGIAPEYPETGYGYIERAEAFGQRARVPVCRVHAFKEKPDRQTAERFVESGRYYWNSGMFVWSIESYAANLRDLDPRLLRLVHSVAHASPGRMKAAIGRLYREAEATSIDYALLERAPLVYAVEADIGWNDIGSWLSLEKCLPSEGDKLYSNARLIAESSRRSLAFAPGKLVAFIGVSDLIVVDTPDALLVCHRDRSQDVKRIVERLQREGLSEYL